MIITIDGPVASGKSSVARYIARESHFFYLCSGILYRAVAYILVHRYHYTSEQLQHPCYADVAAVVIALSYHYTQEHGISVLYGQDVLETARLKHEKIDDAASRISAYVELRHMLATTQRHCATRVKDLIADGRDCGTVVFPQADLKIFLTASLEVRVQRWQKDQRTHGVDVSYENAVTLVQERDRRDMSRSYFPLQQATDAWCIDTSLLSIQEVASLIQGKMRTR